MCDAESERVGMCEAEYARVAHELVDIAINRALALLDESDWCDVPLDEYIVPADVKRRSSLQRTSIDKPADTLPNVTWPTIAEFTPDLGTDKILEFIKVVNIHCQSFIKIFNNSFVRNFKMS